MTRLNNDFPALLPALQSPGLLKSEPDLWPVEADAACSRVALYLRAAGLADAEAEAGARLAVEQALKILEYSPARAGLLKEALARAQFYIVTPLALPRPLSLGHMLPEDFKDFP